MDSKPRSRTVAVKVASEQEPVDCTGSFTEQSDGFVLEFNIHNDAFTVEHKKAFTAVRAKGMMNYDIVLNDAVNFTLLDTPFGQMRFEVKTLKREVVKTDSAVFISLRYVMTNAAVEQLHRAVEITAAFKDTSNREEII